MPPRPASGLARAFAAAALFAGGGCSVADNLSSAEILTEVDGIVRVVPAADGQRLRYAERAQVSSWYMRWFLFVPIRGALGFLFGGTHEGELENPTAHVRDLLRELPDETGGDLITCAQAATRYAWIAELETNAQSCVVAIDGLAGMLQQLEVSLFEGDLTRVGMSLDPARLAAARAGVQLGRPDARGDAALEPSRLQVYVGALGELTSAPLDSAAARVMLAEQLTELCALEPDATAREAAAAALRASLRHVAEGLLVRIVAGRATEFVELRLCAMEQIRRLGGPRTVPLMLAIMAATPEQQARQGSLFDPDPLVQLRLIQYCGQLSGELATTSVQIPRRAVCWSPREFLAAVILQEDAYYSKLRTPALLALTWSLRRPRLDPDPAWVREWWDGRAR